MGRWEAMRRWCMCVIIKKCVCPCSQAVLGGPASLVDASAEMWRALMRWWLRRTNIKNVLKKAEKCEIIYLMTYHIS